MKSIVILFLLTLYSMGFEYHLKPYTVTAGVSCFFGLYGDAKEENGGRVVNTCYVQNRDSYVVIDSGPTYQYAQQAYAYMQKIKPLPVKYVINTTVKEMHVLGNEFYKERGAKLIGPESYYKLFNRGIPLDTAKKISKEAFANTRLVPLDSYLKSDKDIQLGDEKIEIKKFDKDDGKHLVVYFPNKKIVFVGDYVSNGQPPQIDKPYSLDGWKNTLQKIEKLSWNYIISSHGTKRTRTAMIDTKKYLNYLNEKEKRNTKRDFKRHRVNKNIHMLAIKKDVVPSIHYIDFERAKKEAMLENKYVMIKVEASNCEPCIALNHELSSNNHLKEMVNRHTKAVEINADYDTLPMGLTYRGTPTVFLIEPKDDRVIMQIEGTLAVSDLEESLDVFLYDSFRKGVASL